MNPTPIAPAYSRTRIFLHWLSVSLMLSLVFAGETRHLLTNLTAIPMRSVMVVHIGCGMALLAVTLIRALVRISSRRARSAAFSLQDACAHAVHLAIYAVILGECLLGWVIVNAKGFAVPLPYIGLEFPLLVSADPALVSSTVRIHDIFGWMLYGLLGVHIGAALWHHFVARDHTLAKMTWRQRPQAL